MLSLSLYKRLEDSFGFVEGNAKGRRRKVGIEKSHFLISEAGDLARRPLLQSKCLLVILFSCAGSCQDLPAATMESFTALSCRRDRGWSRSPAADSAGHWPSASAAPTTGRDAPSAAGAAPRFPPGPKASSSPPRATTTPSSLRRTALFCSAAGTRERSEEEGEEERGRRGSRRKAPPTSPPGLGCRSLLLPPPRARVRARLPSSSPPSPAASTGRSRWRLLLLLPLPKKRGCCSGSGGEEGRTRERKKRNRKTTPCLCRASSLSPFLKEGPESLRSRRGHTTARP